MAQQNVPRGLAAILAAGVVGYSRMMQADEVSTLAALNPHSPDHELFCCDLVAIQIE
jgi:hypothetical protein